MVSAHYSIRSLSKFKQKSKKNLLSENCSIMKLSNRQLVVEWRQEPDYSVTFFGFFHMYDLGVSFTFDFLKRNWESSVIFLRNGVLFFNCKENKQTSAICFEIRIPKKKNKELLQKIPSKVYGSNFIMGKKPLWRHFESSSERQFRLPLYFSIKMRYFSALHT